MKEALPPSPKKEKHLNKHFGDKENSFTKSPRPQNNKKSFQKESSEENTPSANTFEDKMKEWLKAANEKQAVLNKRINKR